MRVLGVASRTTAVDAACSVRASGRSMPQPMDSAGEQSTWITVTTASGARTCSSGATMRTCACSSASRRLPVNVQT